ncbi:hypothetical protein CC86DRAFT_437061 [Ophiobolus disseminans]|uniref:Uncharacterized protein n=1 Tax=Ophiobolus disseminans TaxID=1469910 RepID=A0A6A7A7Q0_9PLEO|nr:hypothetical protein CC86DRAFT_437061 [Ophiobolus disseminans]
MHDMLEQSRGEELRFAPDAPSSDSETQSDTSSDTESDTSSEGEENTTSEDELNATSVRNKTKATANSKIESFDSDNKETSSSQINEVTNKVTRVGAQLEKANAGSLQLFPFSKMCLANQKNRAGSEGAAVAGSAAPDTDSG